MQMNEFILQAEGLTKRYGALTAVNGLSLGVYAGEVFGFLGPNGAGKTTSIKMICGLVRPDAGRVLFCGVPLSGARAEARAQVGVCPQETVLWPALTCLEQLEFVGEMYGTPPRLARRRGLELLETLGLAEKSSSLARTLSGGMQRRLNLSLALVHDPDLVVLDEPEAGLDPQTRLQVREFIRSLAPRKTVILTTHNMDEAERVTDRVAIIDHGELLVLDTPAALKRRVGEGDVLEISLKREAKPTAGEIGEDERCALARLSLADLFEDGYVSFDGRGFRIQALDAAARLPAVLERLASTGLACGEVRLRQNTLEDVFIQLTGRRLRE
jgi:ABC-2 type transport system ATP-binding protein